jgi:oligo-1,6-glucosidase
MQKKWWQEGIVYQIYPRSFYDSNGDGIGDIRGIIEKIDYLKNLGVNIIWLNPVYKAPNDDNGYDISDYQDIMEEFGTLTDWEELLEKLHSNGMKLIMDLVVNHTSDEHKWFIESRSSKDNPYRDYYIWRPGRHGKEPNNWMSVFGGSAWEYDEQTGEYYLHLFTKKQPDLNWDNPAVRKEIVDMMNWWLDKGIDGFRMDVINMISKPEGLPDLEDATHDGFTANLSAITNGPRVHDYIKYICQNSLSKYDVMSVGETPGTTLQQAKDYVSFDRCELNMVIQFEHVEIDYGSQGRYSIAPWKLVDFKNIFSRWQYELHEIGWNCIYLMNHDQSRSVSRYGNDSKEYRKLSAKLLATFMLTIGGTPFIYQGEEIGMTNVQFDSIDDYRDIETLNYYNDAIKKGISPQEALKVIHYRSRDNSRTPLQWNTKPNAGFTTGQPWMKVNPNYTEINIEKDMNKPDSIFHYYKQLIELRKHNPAMIYGEYTLLDKDNESIYAYLKKEKTQTLLILLNFSCQNRSFSCPQDIKQHQIKVITGNYPAKQDLALANIQLKPYEALVLEIL